MTKTADTGTRAAYMLGYRRACEAVLRNLQLDGSAPKPVGKVTFDELQHFVATQTRMPRGAFT